MKTPSVVDRAKGCRPGAVLTVAFAASLAFACGAAAPVAQTYDSPVLTPATGAIHDPADATGTNYNGSLATMLASSLTVSDVPVLADPIQIQSAELTVWIQHDFAGDLTIKLVSPTGTIVTVLNRPGSGAPDDGSQIGGAGASANFSVQVPITFVDAAATSAEDIGLGLGGDTVIGLGSPAIFAPDNDAATGVGPFTDAGAGSFSAFFNEDPVGTWTLFLADSGAYNTGYLQKWRLRLTMVPEPSALVLLLLGAGSMLRRH